MSRTCPALIPPLSIAACAIAWSRIESPSRADPSAARAISASASGSACTPLGLGDIGEMLRQQLRRDALQVEPLAARQHRHRHLVHLGGREQELHVPRRLLQRLQQPVEGRFRQHVDLVDDIDLVARRDRRIAHRLNDLADVVDACVAGGIHLDHVDMPPPRRSPRTARTIRTDRSSGRPFRPARCSSAPWRSAARWRSCPPRAPRSAGRHAPAGRA